jgi:hypothetical protein
MGNLVNLQHLGNDTKYVRLFQAFVGLQNPRTRDMENDAAEADAAEEKVYE